MQLHVKEMEDLLPQEPTEVISNITVPMRGRSHDRGRGRGTTAKGNVRQEDTDPAQLLSIILICNFSQEERTKYIM